jgi:MtN3 and saliva related transmembrane protein
MSAVTVVGIVAALASTVSYAPQAWRVIKTRETKGISAPAYALTVCAFVAWVAYGILLGDWPLIITNSVCLVFSTFIFVMTLLPRAKREAVADALQPGVDS